MEGYDRTTSPMDRFDPFLFGGISHGLYSFGIRGTACWRVLLRSLRRPMSVMVGFGWRRFFKKSGCRQIGTPKYGDVTGSIIQWRVYSELNPYPSLASRSAGSNPPNIVGSLQLVLTLPWQGVYIRSRKMSV